MTIQARRQPRRLTRILYRLPVWLYRLRLGRLLGKRFLLIEHTGRKSGRRYQTVVEVAGQDRRNNTYMVASGYGPRADWYLNLKHQPNVTIKIGNHRLAVTAELLSPEASGEAMVTYARQYPAAAKGLARLLGHAVQGDEASYRRLGETAIPFVSFSPRSEEQDVV